MNDSNRPVQPTLPFTRPSIDEEPQRRMSTEQFAARWSAQGSSVAFFDPGVWEAWRRRGLPGHVLAADNYTVAVSRQ